MYRLTSKITVGNYQFNFCNEIEVESSWQSLTDTAVIRIPKKLTVDNKPIVEGNKSVFKVGDKVKIELGYDYKTDVVFEGYLSNVKIQYPIELLCEDKMWLFKQVSFLKTFKHVTVKELVTMITNKIKTPIEVVYSFPNMQLGKFRISNATGAQVLEELRKTYGIYSFFREGKLYVGFARTHTDSNYRKHIPLQFRPNIIENNLLYKNKDNIKIKVKATSIHSDNKQEVVEVGDGDGIVVDVFRYNLSKADLTAYANSIRDTYKVSGFEGTVTTFGKPFIRQGDAVELRDDKTVERNGTYLVKKVKRSYGQSGYRQIVEIDVQVN